jgi:hypothetical protein
MTYSAEITDLAAIRDVLALDPAGRVIWRERSPDLFARLAPMKDPIAGAARFNQDKAGQSPKYYHAKPRGHYIAALLGRVYLDTLAQALGADLRALQDQARQASKAQLEQDSKKALLRLVRLDYTGRPVWKRRTPDNAPQTPESKRADFNAKHAGRALRARPELGGGLIYKIGYFKIDQDKALQWLQDAARPEPETEPGDAILTVDYVKARLAEGKTLQQIASAVRVDFPDFDEFDDKTLQDVLQSLL